MFRLRIRHPEHVPPDGPVILAANHASYLDPPLVGTACKRRLTYLAKQELFFFPFSAFLRYFGAVPVARGIGDASALRTVIRVLREGGAVLLFPEGTRTPDGGLQSVKAGLGLIAEQTGAAIVPTAIQGTYRALPRGSWFPRPVRVTITFCPALRAEAYREILAAKGGRQRLADQVMVEIARRSDDAAVPIHDHATACASLSNGKGVGE